MNLLFLLSGPQRTKNRPEPGKGSGLWKPPFHHISTTSSLIGSPPTTNMSITIPHIPLTPSLSSLERKWENGLRQAPATHMNTLLWRSQPMCQIVPAVCQSMPTIRTPTDGPLSNASLRLLLAQESMCLTHPFAISCPN